MDETRGTPVYRCPARQSPAISTATCRKPLNTRFPIRDSTSHKVRMFVDKRERC